MLNNGHRTIIQSSAEIAEKEIYQDMNSNLRKIEENFAEFREFAENSRA